MKQEFNGERLKEARIYRGVTITDLSKSLNLTKQMISKYENGLSNPNFETVSKLVLYLNFPKKFFYETDEFNLKIGNTYFRSLYTTSKRDQDRQQYPLKIISTIRILLDEYVKFPKLDLPEIDDGNFVEWSTPEKAAESLRKYWGLGKEPIPNMVRLLESKGFVLSAFVFNNANIDAFGRRQKLLNEDWFIISLGDDKKVAVRRRFNAAHELGHAILHEPYIDVDEITKEQYKMMEQEAHDFAAAFLLPKEPFIEDLSSHPTDLNNYIYLKSKWKVSISAMTVRAHRLGIINQAQYQSLQRKISQEGWRKQEPLDNRLKIEQPVALKQAIELIIENDILSGEEIVTKLSEQYNLSLYGNEIEQILNLPKGTLSPETRNDDNVYDLFQLKGKRDN